MKFIMFFGLALLGAASAGIICRPSARAEGGCKIDGSGCEGEHVELSAYNLSMDKWDDASKEYTQVGIMGSHTMAGRADTWEMYTHGPLFRAGERPAGDEGVPPVYFHATWNNAIYRFDNMSVPALGAPLEARMKMVGHADSPSTAFPFDDKDGKLKGVFVAEGQPFWYSKSGNVTEVYKGGVSYLDKEQCNQVFPSVVDDQAWLKQGEVVNTVVCHPQTEICFFTVWKFYDDQHPFPEMSFANDCVHYCILNDISDPGKGCKAGGVLLNEIGDKLCHRDGIGAVHGMTVGHTDPQDPMTFDVFFVFTGGALFDGGESSMRKAKVQRVGDEVKVLGMEVFANQLFNHTVAAGHDVGGDHVWVDDGGKYLWVSTFRVGNPGVHMIDYNTGELIYTIHGVDKIIKDNYSYTAGIHGTGQLGKLGSYIAVATSACKDTKVCAPIPWNPMTKKLNIEASGVIYIIDISKIHHVEKAKQTAAIII